MGWNRNFGKHSPLLPDGVPQLESLFVYPSVTRNDGKLFMESVTSNNVIFLIDLSNVLYRDTETGCAGINEGGQWLLDLCKKLTLTDDESRLFGCAHGNPDTLKYILENQVPLGLRVKVTTASVGAEVSTYITHARLQDAIAAQLSFMVGVLPPRENMQIVLLSCSLEAIRLTQDLLGDSPARVFY